MRKQRLALAVLTGAAILAAGAAQARDQIRIVGSSTVFPFSTAVAERFGRGTDFKTPVVESTGTGGGFKLFCAGVGERYPDIVNASRRMKRSEFETCARNGVTVTEVAIGYDGIVLANSKAGPAFDLSLRQIFLALAKQVPGPDGTLIDNPHENWRDIDPALPDARIEVLGPPPTSGTRDAFVELAMEGGAATFEALKRLGTDHFKAVAHGIREDGAFIETGENDNLIVQKLSANPKAIGIFGFSFLDQNADRIQGAKIGGVAPSFANIAGGDYGVSRSLFFYVKRRHVGSIPGILEFIGEFTAERAWGEDGYLIDKGLIPLPAAERQAMRAQAIGLAPLVM